MKRKDKKDCEKPQPCLCDICPKCGSHKTGLQQNLASRCKECNFAWL